MADYDDLTRGTGIDEALVAVSKQLEPWNFDDDPDGAMLALLLLDERFGLRKPGDYVYITPAFVWAVLPFKVLDPTLQAYFALDREKPSVKEQEAALERATERPFDVELTFRSEFYEEHGCQVPDMSTLPETLRGKTIRVRLMPEGDAERLTAMMTRRETGERIILPRPDEEPLY